MMFVKLKINTSYLFLIGYICLFFVLTFSISILSLKPNQTFSPINNQYSLCGDYRFYSSAINKTIYNFHSATNLLSNINENETTFDHSRLSLNILAALTSLFIKDGRISFITSYIISTIIGICLLLWLIQQHTRSKYTSIALSIIFYFYFNIFRSILNFNINDSWEILQNSLLNTNFTVFLESFNDNFRYLVLSHVNIIMFSSFLLGQFIQNAKKINSAAVVIISLFLFIILYSYLPAILYTYAIIFGLLFWRYFTENDKTVFLILILLFIFCFVTNTFNNLYQIYMNVPQAVTQAHLNKITEWGLNNIFRHTDLLFSFLISSITWLISKKFKFKCNQYLAIISIFMFIQLLSLISGKTLLLHRFFIRGGFSYFFVIILFFIAELTQWIQKYFHHITKFTVLTIIVILPLYLGLSMGFALNESESFSISKNIWQAYSWLENKNKNNQSVLAMNINDIQLLQSLTSQNLIITGAEYSRDPFDEFKKYSYFTSLFGVPNEIISGAKNYDYIHPRLQCFPKPHTFSYTQAESTILIDQIFYFPYISSVNKISAFENDQLSTDFIRLIKTTNQNISKQLYQLPSYVIFDKLKTYKVNSLKALNYEKVFENSDRVIFLKK